MLGKPFFLSAKTRTKNPSKTLINKRKTTDIPMEGTLDFFIIYQKKFFKMSGDQTNSPIVNMQIDNYAMGNNSSNIVNNYPAPPPPNSEHLPDFPNQVLEAISTIKKYLSRQPSNHEIKITGKEVKVNDRTIFVKYEACKICKLQHGNLFCSACGKKSLFRLCG